MATRSKNKRKGPLADLVRESVQDLNGAGFDIDPTLDENDRELTGPERFAKGQKQKDEVLIDTQLASIQNKEGYFLKLKKEMRPNEWMLMKTIHTEWRRWPDVETAVADIVKEHTKIAPGKWGSGPYRIEYACKGGIRGPGYDPLDFYINAEEEFLTNQGMNGQVQQPAADATTQVTAQLEMLGKLTDIINSNKPAGLDVGQVQSQIAGAFEKGLSIKAGEGNNNNAMMMTMMTGLMGMMTAMATKTPEQPKVVNPTEGLKDAIEMMKNMGVIGNQSVEKPKTFAETLMELKTIGIDIFKKDDPMEQMGKLKQFASIASDLMGIGGTAERPGILEKMVDMLGPSLPQMVTEIANASKNAVAVQVEAGKNIERAKIGVSTPVNQPINQPVVYPTPEGQPMNNAVPQQNPQVIAFFNGLHTAVKDNNRLFYPVIYTSLLQDPKGVELINGIVNGTHTAKELVELLQGYGDARFKDSEFVMKHLVSYTNGFIIWLRDMVKPKAYAEVAQEVAPAAFVAPKGPGFDVMCPVCNTEFVLDSEEDLNKEENKVCGQNGCVGMLQPVAKVS
jgi:hypothetical protein